MNGMGILSNKCTPYIVGGSHINPTGEIASYHYYSYSNGIRNLKRHDVPLNAVVSYSTTSVCLASNWFEVSSFNPEVSKEHEVT